jgi:hypothetical protein
MSNYEAKDYWEHIHDLAHGVADRVREKDGHLSDVLFEETDGTEWSIYTRMACLVMSYTYNQDALMERHEDLGVFTCWGLLVSAAAVAAIYADVSDYYHRSYTEAGEKKEKA